MKRFDKYAAGFVCFLVYACSDPPEACVEAHSGTPLQSAASGQFVLTSAGEELEVPLRLELEGLPELWPAGGPASGRLLVTFDPAYEGGERNREMPALEARVDVSGARSDSANVPQRQAATTIHLYVPLFSPYDDDGACDGEVRRCEREVLLSFSRTTGEPYGPITVHWEAQATAEVYDCVVPAAPATLELRVQ
jgi:hypothetical protein